MVWRDLNNPRIWKNAPERVRGVYRDHYANYRRILSQVRPFNIDDNALEVAIELSLEGPEKMAQRLFMARLPFPKVWIEFNFHQRVRIGERLGISTPLDDAAPERLGWILQEDQGDPLRWSAVTWSSVGNSQPVHTPHKGEMLASMGLSSWLVDTANRAAPERIGNINGVDRDYLSDVVRVSDAAYEKHGEDSWKAFAHLGWGYSAAEGFSAAEAQSKWGARPPDRMRQLTIADTLKNSINIGWEPLMYQLQKEKHLTPEAREQFVSSTIESRGDVRLIATILSLINEVPIIETPTQTRGSFSGGGVIRRYLTNNTVTINIPSRKPLGQIRKILAKKAKSHKARHEVRGHIRTIIHKEDHIRKRKQPDGTIVEEFIAKGQLERVWVNHHERGDAAYGYVRHDYRVEKSGKSGRANKQGTLHLSSDSELSTWRKYQDRNRQS